MKPWLAISVALLLCGCPDAEPTPAGDDGPDSVTPDATTGGGEQDTPTPDDVGAPPDSGSTDGQDIAAPEDAPEPEDAVEPEELPEPPDEGTGVDVQIPEEITGPEDTGPPSCDPSDCDDNNVCTTETCTDEGECINAGNTEACDDGEPCTELDQCNAGVCKGLIIECDDKEICTADACMGGECVFVATAEGTSCDDGNTCTAGEKCTSGACAGGKEADCDDNQFCTDDVCVNDFGCYNQPTPEICTDGNACTLDTCNETTDTCKSTQVVDGTACDDGDPCTKGDTCTANVCEAGAEPLVCDDGNSCTADSCEAGTGCVYDAVADGGECDDGSEATVEDVCKAGQCKGVADDCSKTLGLTNPTIKVTSLGLGSTASEGLDLDGDGLPDNALGPLALLVQGQLVEVINNGSLIYLSHLQGFNPDAPFPVHFFLGQKASTNPDCDVQEDVCDYRVDSTGFDEECNPTSSFPVVTWDGTKVKSVEPGTFTLTFALAGTVHSLEMKMAQIDVQLALTDTTVDSFLGKVGGAVLKDDLLLLASLLNVGVDLAPIIENGIPPDIDTDDDGEPDAMSLVLKVSGHGGNIVGVFDP